MPNACAASVQLCAVRVTRLDGAGVPDPGASNLYISDSFADISFSPETRQGEDFEGVNGCGEIIVSFRDCPRERWWNFSATLLKPDPELMEMMLDGDLLTLSGDTRGFQTRTLLTAACGNGVGVEYWTKRIVDGDLATDGFPYWRWTLPKVRNLAVEGDTSFGNDITQIAMTGEAIENVNWFDGPLNDGLTLADQEMERAWNYVQDSGIPATACGYATLSAS